MKAEVFSSLPNELETIEIDVKKRKFLINGKSFGRSLGFTLSLDTRDGYKAEMQIGTNVEFAGYEMSGKKKPLNIAAVSATD